MRLMRGMLGGVAMLPVLAGLLPARAASPVTVEKPWIRYLLPNIPVAGYMVLRNSGDQDAVLTKAASPACGSLMLHESREQSGIEMMMDVPSVTVPAHASIAFAPGGYHLMCMHPKMRVGDKIRVTLSFADGAEIRTEMPVYGPQDAP